MQEERRPRQVQVEIQPSLDSSAEIESMLALLDKLLHYTGSRRHFLTDFAKIQAM